MAEAGDYIIRFDIHAHVIIDVAIVITIGMQIENPWTAVRHVELVLVVVVVFVARKAFGLGIDYHYWFIFDLLQKTPH